MLSVMHFVLQSRGELFDEFTEQKVGNNRKGRRTMFGDVGGDLWNPTQDRRGFPFSGPKVRHRSMMLFILCYFLFFGMMLVILSVFDG